MPIPPYDIFRAHTDGHIWQACTPTLEDAQSHIKALAADSPGDFIIVNQQTGNTLFIHAKAPTEGQYGSA